MHEFRLGHKSSQNNAANINRAESEGSIYALILRRWFVKFRSADTKHEDQGDRGCPSVNDNQNLKTLIEQNLCQNVKEISQIRYIIFSTISDHCTKISTVKKSVNWFHINSVKVKILTVSNEFLTTLGKNTMYSFLTSLQHPEI